jgi:membrane associated rhomboid family serine protease
MFNERVFDDKVLGVFITFLPAFFVVLWYLIVQDGGSSYNFSLIRNERIISSFRSIVSHVNLGHLLLNVVVYLLYSVPLVFIYKNRYIVVLLLSGILIEIAKYTEYIHIFGMSGLVKFIGGCLLLSFLYSTYVGKINNNLVMTKTIPCIVLVATIPPTVGDILIVTEVVNTSNLGQASYLFYGSIPNTYTKVSAVVHIDGFISGLSLTSCLIILSQQVDIEVFKR